MSGKGSGRRPAAISDAQYQERWDAIFCKDLCTSEECAKESGEIYTDAPVDTTDDTPNCKDDPRAPHGFMRNASLNADRYVCECEFWLPDVVTDAQEIREWFEKDEEDE